MNTKESLPIIFFFGVTIWYSLRASPINLDLHDGGLVKGKTLSTKNFCIPKVEFETLINGVYLIHPPHPLNIRTKLGLETLHPALWLNLFQYES